MRARGEEITGLLLAWSDGDQSALDRLIPMVYGELHRLARFYLSRESSGHILQTTALVNEAYLRLVDASRVRWKDRAHFFAVSAALMRRILVDFARSRRCKKRSVGIADASFDDEGKQISHPRQGVDVVVLDEALETMAAFDPRSAKVVELRFFGGLTVEEAADVLRVSAKTVKRDWAAAKAWLLGEMNRRGT